MASRLELRRLRDVPPFLAAALRIRRQMLGSLGARVLSLVAKAATGRLLVRRLDGHGHGHAPANRLG
jgi:hypothetical protein